MRFQADTLRPLTTLALVLAASAVYGQVKVVNMIPNSLSNETQRDSEPSVAVDPANPQRIAASAFTPDPASSGSGPIFVSTDGGVTWVLSVVLPGGNKTGDTSIRFGGSSGVLYGGILRSDVSLRMNILRKADFTAAGLMDVLVTRDSEDQPWVEAATVLGGTGSAADRVFVGDNNFGVATSPRKTATVDRSQSAAVAPAPAGFSTTVVEARSTGSANQDGPAIRTAQHPDGTVYAVFYGWTSASGSTKTSDIVVVRDDAWGSGVTPFAVLTDGDGFAGKRVVSGTTVVFNQMLGNQRTGGQLAIAVDPNDSSTVYVAWCDGTPTYTLHLRRSTNRGATWSADLRTISGATNPALAINTAGKVGFMYQQLVNPGGGNRWQTHLERSTDGFASPPVDNILANVPDSLGSYAGPNPIGDYANLVAVGKNFYGVFSAFNTPDNANFPSTVVYQRNANFTTNQLLGTDGTTVVAASIDPFFLKVTEGPAPDSDFYVRDWTDGPGSGDDGAEPSTHAVFYQTSDVWNRRGTLPGTFPSDQPENEDAGNGSGNIGDNWAFARVRRKALPVSGSKTVTAHFLVSKLGTGSNYVDGTSGDPDVAFLDPDPTLTFGAADLGPTLTTPVKWHLEAVASTHLCLAVEISTPDDPMVPPSLLGRAPGWPTTDLSVIYDNNKAQRNMGLSTTPARGEGMTDSFYVIAHNAATFTRTMEVRYQVDPSVLRRLAGAQLEVVGGPATQPISLRPKGNLRLTAMTPGENRWIGVRFPAPQGREGELLPVHFFEVVDGKAVNGFGLAARPAAMGRVVHDVMEAHRSIFTRIAAFAHSQDAQEESEAALRFLREGGGEQRYQDQLKAHLPLIAKSLNAASLTLDPFGVAVASRNLASTVARGRPEGVAMAHQTLLHKLDAHLTRLQLQEGDPADILQTVRWHRDLLRHVPRLGRLGCAQESAARMDAFIVEIESRRRGTKDYPELIQAIHSCFEKTAKAFAKQLPDLKKAIPDPETSSLAALQKAHRAFLLQLQRLQPRHVTAGR